MRRAWTIKEIMAILEEDSVDVVFEPPEKGIVPNEEDFDEETTQEVVVDKDKVGTYEIQLIFEKMKKTV